MKTIYTPVIKHSNGKSPFSIGNTSSKGSFSIAMLDYQRVGIPMRVVGFELKKTLTKKHPDTYPTFVAFKGMIFMTQTDTSSLGMTGCRRVTIKQCLHFSPSHVYFVMIADFCLPDFFCFPWEFRSRLEHG